MVESYVKASGEVVSPKGVPKAGGRPMARPEANAAPLAPVCKRCGNGGDVGITSCRHMKLCMACGYHLAQAKAACSECRTPITSLNQEYEVKSLVASNKQFLVGRFLQGLPNLSKKNHADPKWNMERDGLNGRQPTETLREKFKGRPFMLADDVGQQSFQGQLEGGQQATYYLLLHHGRNVAATPVHSWYNFQKVAHYKQLTLEEAEEQMRNRRKTADGYQRWLMKASSTGAAAFNDMENIGGSAGGRSRRKGGDDEDNPGSDRGEEDEDEEEARKNRLGKNRGAQTGEEDGEEPARDLDLDEEEPEKGDDWEHEETFTDDDEAVGNDPEEREDVNPEVGAPPEIKQEEEDEAEGEEGDQQEGGGLSQSGKELKKLLGKSGDLDDMDGAEEEDEDDDGLETEEIGMSPVLLPSKKVSVKEETKEATASKAATPSPAPARVTPAPNAKGKRKSTADDGKPTPPAGKRAKAEQTAAGKAPAPTMKKESPAKPVAGPGAGAKAGAPLSKAAIMEEDIRTILAAGPIKSHELVAKFRQRLTTKEDKTTFADILKKISRIQKQDGGSFIVLR